MLSLGILQSGEVSTLDKSLKETPGCSRAVLSQPKGELQPPSGGVALLPGDIHLGEREKEERVGGE